MAKGEAPVSRAGCMCGPRGPGWLSAVCLTCGQLPGGLTGSQALRGQPEHWLALLLCVRLLCPPRAAGGPDVLGTEQTGSHCRLVLGSRWGSWGRGLRGGLRWRRVSPRSGLPRGGKLRRTTGPEADLGPVGLRMEGGGRCDEPAPPCGVGSATQKVGAKGPG